MRDRPNDQHRSNANAQPGEVIHHKDEDKSNNAPGNLEKMPAAQHNAITAKSRGSKLTRLRSALRMHKERRKLY